MLRGQNFRVTICCCGCSLKTGCIIIGALEFIAGFAGFIFLLYTLTNYELSGAMLDMTGVFVGYTILVMLLSSILIFATLKEKPTFLLAWLVTIGIMAAISLVLDVVFKMGRVGIALVPLDVLLQLYCLLVVHSYRVQILTQNEPTILGNGDNKPTNNEFENKEYYYTYLKVGEYKQNCLTFKIINQDVLT